MSKKVPKKLWILQRTGDESLDSGDAVGFVVKSTSMWAARRHAAGEAGGEGAPLWMDPAKTSCLPLQSVGKAGVVIRSFVNG